MKNLKKVVLAANLGLLVAYLAHIGWTVQKHFAENIQFDYICQLR